MADVFISYASEDREAIRPLIQHIEASGYSVWWDRQIGVGANFDREIERELAAAACVLVIWSPNSIESEWVYNEAQEGHDRGVLIPVSLDDTRPPLAFRRVQTAALTGFGSEGELEAVTAAIADALGREGAKGGSEANKAAPISPSITAAAPRRSSAPPGSGRRW